MTHLDAARSIARAADRADLDVTDDLLRGILHALLASAERMDTPPPAVAVRVPTVDNPPEPPEPTLVEALRASFAAAKERRRALADPVADALDEMAARQADEPECPHEGCRVMEVHCHHRHSTPPATPPAVPCSLACGDGGQSTVGHVRGSTALTRCYRPRRQEGGR